MKEILLVSISALLGYIVFSAFSTSTNFEEAARKIIEQPHADMQLQQELAFSKLANDKEKTLLTIDNDYKMAQLQSQENITISQNANTRAIELKKIDSSMSSALVNMKLQSEIAQKKQQNFTYIIIAFFLFILIFIYLRHKKNLAESVLEKEIHYKEMLAKKEYAEKILTLLATGDVGFEMERKLLKILDELNGNGTASAPREIIYHPNPEIADLSMQDKQREYR